jgi:mannose-1-phosphate guanylyltransferase/mannose-6-phosphate isomerase
MRRIIPVILSGGSGTRLWPLSRELAPKQLLPLVTGHTLLQETLLRTRGLAERIAPPIIVCNEAHRFLVAEQFRAIDAAPQAIVLEPAGRNTAPAVAVAALLAESAARSIATGAPPGSGPTPNSSPLLLVLPADHVILDSRAFTAAVEAAVEAAEAGRLVTFGIVPDRPETGYGYLLRGASQGPWSLLERFVEKPDLATAEQYLASGKYLWNSGMFVFSAGAYLEELGRHAPAMLAQCRQAVAAAERDADFTRLGAAFLDCPADSIDYAVMEKTRNAAVVPLDAGWSDIGSWSALYEVLEKDAAGNVLRGDVIEQACKNTYVAASGRLVAVVGLDGVIVVETPDAVLVMAAEQSQRVKQIVDALKAAGRDEVRVVV